MQKAGTETRMLHYCCDVCAMSATVVATSTAVLAWLDHMARHADPSLYRCWEWTVVPLFAD